jgi:hypothetical protein
VVILATPVVAFLMVATPVVAFLFGPFLAHFHSHALYPAVDRSVPLSVSANQGGRSHFSDAAHIALADAAHIALMGMVPSLG